MPSPYIIIIYQPSVLCPVDPTVNVSLPTTVAASTAGAEIDARIVIVAEFVFTRELAVMTALASVLEGKSRRSVQFLVVYTRLYKSLCRSIGPSVSLLVRLSVGPSVVVTLLKILPKSYQNCIIAPAHHM